MRSIFGQRSFRLYFVGGSLSNIGTWFQNIAAGLLVYELTRSTLLVGLVNFSLFIGAVIFAPWAGAAADRLDRRRLLVVTQLGAALIGAALAALTLLGLVTAPTVIVASLLLGLMLAFGVPAMMALIPQLVRDEDLEAAVALNSLSFNLARAVGPMLGALAVEWAGYGLGFALNAASFVLFAGALLAIRPRPQKRDRGSHASFGESLRVVRDNPRLAVLLVTVMAVSTSTDPINTLPPELVRDVFGQRDLYVGLLVGAFGTGATLTALLLTGWLRRQRRVLAAAMTVQGVGMAMVGLAPTIWLAIAAMFVSGAGYLAAISRCTARVYAEVDDAQRGRVMALWSLAFLGTRPLASLVDGAIAEIAGARTAAVALALPVLAAAIWVHHTLPPVASVAPVTDDPTP